MSEIRLNLNDIVKVRLTDLGKDIFCHQFDDINQKYGKIICISIPLKEDEAGYVKFQLWDFISIYGSYIGLAKPNIIDPIEIIYELPEESDT